MENTFSNFIEYTLISRKDIIIFKFNVLKEFPSPFEWTCAKEDFKNAMEKVKTLNKKFVYMFDVRLVGMLTITHVKEFVEILEIYSSFLETTLLFSAVIAEGVIIKAIYEVIKIFYKTKKELKILNTMEEANLWIDETCAKTAF
jgi:hypothetical protein